MGVSKNIGGSNSPTRLQGGPGDPVYTGIDGTRVYIRDGTPFGGGGADDTMEVYNAVAPDGSTNLVTRYWTDGSLTFSDGRIGSSTTGSARIDGDAPFRGNGTAWGLFSSVGVVLNEELAAGVIPHAVGVALGNNILSLLVPGPGAVLGVEGVRVDGAHGRAVPDHDALGSDRGDAARALLGDTLRAALVFWRAVKDYGAIIRDGTGANGSWWYTDATGMPPGIDWSGIVRVPTFWSAANWRVPARSVY